MRLVIDIDGTICSDTRGNYKEAKPFTDKIMMLNDLFTDGHLIVLHTGRHWDNLLLTYNQLAFWGVKYHSLVMGKPPADFLADDKAEGIDEIYKTLNGITCM